MQQSSSFATAPRSLAGVAAALLMVVSAWPVLAGKFDTELKRYDYEIEVQTLQTMNALLTPKQFAQQIHFTFPVMPPMRSVDEVKALIETEVMRVVQERYPDTQLEAITQEAQTKFRMYQVGDKVSLRARRTGPDFRLVTGTLRLVTSDVIKLGDEAIPVIDLSDGDQAHFDLRKREQAVNDYIMVNQRRFREERDKYEGDKRLEIAAFVYKENGYYQVKGNWYPTKLVFDKLYQQERKKLYNQLRPDIVAKVLKPYGWMLDPKSHEWVNPDLERSSGEAEAAVTEVRPTSTLDKLIPMMKRAVSTIYGHSGDDSTTGGIDDPNSLFSPGSVKAPEKQPPPPAPEPAPAPEGAAPAPAPAPPAASPTKAPKANVSDLYDEN